MRRRPTPVLLAGVFLACSGAFLGGARTAHAQETAGTVCAEGRISNIFVDNHDIFDLEQLEQGTAVRWAYSLANALHVRTAQSFIRREILFEVGDCLDPLLLEESGRILRQYGFIASADVYSIRQPDGSHHVVVDTQDEWTTRIDFGPDMYARLGVTPGLDYYPSSGGAIGELAFGTDEKRLDFLLKQFEELWSPAFWFQGEKERKLVVLASGLCMRPELTKFKLQDTHVEAI